jgi:hypothetical protein
VVRPIRVNFRLEKLRLEKSQKTKGLSELLGKVGEFGEFV